MKTLEQAAEAYAEGLAIKNQYERVVEEIDVIAGFFAGAEWQKKQMCNDCPNRGNTHSYLQGYEDGKKYKNSKNYGNTHKQK